MTKDLADDARIPAHFAVPEPAPEPAVQGNKRKHAKTLKMRESPIQKGFTLERVNPRLPLLWNCMCQIVCFQ